MINPGKMTGAGQNHCGRVFAFDITTQTYLHSHKSGRFAYDGFIFSKKSKNEIASLRSQRPCDFSPFLSNMTSKQAVWRDQYLVIVDT